MDVEEKIGASFEARVQGLASDGRGVLVHPSGRRFFVAGVCVGESVVAKITQLKGRVGFAECVEVAEKSHGRQAAFCSHHGFGKGSCGGCAWQFMTYEEQLLRKQERVEGEFLRLDSRAVVEKIWPSAKLQGYRNRAQFKTDGAVLAYLSAASNTLAEIRDCPILTDKNRHTLAQLRERLPVPAWRPGKKALQKQQWTTLDIDEDLDAQSVSVNQRRPFRQANEQQNEAIKHWLHSKLMDLDKHRSVIELFCGSGNLTEVIAAQGFASIIAIEGVQSALDILQTKQLPGVQPRLANLFSAEALGKIFSKKSTADILVLDPPRDGMKEKTALANKKSPLKDVFYVSCDLATLVRDLAFFLDHKFRLIEVQPLDQFPHTPHIELLVHLRRKV